MTRYTTGTVTVVNGSHIINGSGTYWNSLSLPLVFAIEDGNFYECSRIVSNTVLWLAEPYDGTGASAQSYTLSDSFIPNYNIPLIQTRDVRLADTITTSLLAIERKMFSLGVADFYPKGYRQQQYVTGYTFFEQDSTVVTGYQTEWLSLDEGFGSSGGEINSYFLDYFPSNYFPYAFWLYSSSESGYYYIKKYGDSTVYKVNSIESDTSLSIDTAYDFPYSYLDYSDSFYYFPGNVVVFSGLLWKRKAGPKTYDIAPIADYDSSTTYYYGNFSYDGTSIYTFINETPHLGTAPPNSTYWRESTVSELRSMRNDYWSLYSGDGYMIVSSATENYLLPLMTSGSYECWDWFTKSMELLDALF